MFPNLNQRVGVYRGQFKASRNQGGAVPEFSYSGRLILPPQALQDITSLLLEFPLVFQVRGKNDRFTHCGVIEFTAPPGKAIVPEWMAKRLGITYDKDIIHVNTVQLPRGQTVKLQPQEVNFIDISNPGVVLEKVFRNYPTLTIDDIICFSYAENVYNMKVLELSPTREGGADILNCDVRVDFAPPLGYVEPVYTPAVISSPQSTYDPLQPPSLSESEESDDKPDQPFSGDGRSLAGVSRLAGQPSRGALGPKTTEKLLPVVQKNGVLAYKTETEVNELRESTKALQREKEEESRAQLTQSAANRKKAEEDKKAWVGTPNTLRD